MSISKYPDGFSDGVAILGMPVLNLYGGDVYWVSSDSGSADSTGQKGDFDMPFATIDYAIGRCKANNGDQIFVKPRHSETVTGVAGIALDVAGVTITGFGRGASKPTILMDGAATVTAAVTAANVVVKGLRFSAGHADVASCFVVTAADFMLEDVDFIDNAANENWLSPVDTTGAAAEAASGLSITDCTWTSVDAGCLGFVKIVEDISRITVERCVLNVDLATNVRILLVTAAKDQRGQLLIDNFISSANGNGVTSISDNATTTANSGFVVRNRCKHLDTTTTHLLFPAGGIGACTHDNQSTSVVTLQGFLLPVVDS